MTKKNGPKWGLIAIILGAPIAAGIGGAKVLDSTGLGVVVGIVAFVVIVAVLIKTSPKVPSMTPRTAAWEAKMNAGLLEKVIAQRLAERDREPDAAKRGRRDREVEFLKEQLEQAIATWAAEDPSPGRGYVGFKPYDGD
jgi:hypothetical protein